MTFHRDWEVRPAEGNTVKSVMCNICVADYPVTPELPFLVTRSLFGVGTTYWNMHEGIMIAEVTPYASVFSTSRGSAVT